MSLTKGVLTYCYGKTYEKFAYALADSCQVLGLDLTVVSDNNSLLKHPNINLVYKENKSLNAFEIEKYSYVLSPYDLTLKVDIDVLLLSRVDDYFNLAKSLGLVSGKPNNYCTVAQPASAYRKKEENYFLPEIYSTAICFSKSPIARDFFKTVKYLFENWYSLDMSKDLSPTTDTVMSVAWKLQNVPITKILDFTHFKKHLAYDSKKLLWYANGVVLNGNKLEGIFHYYEKDFLENNKELVKCLLS